MLIHGDNLLAPKAPESKCAIAQEDTVTPKLPPEIIGGMGQSILAGYGQRPGRCPALQA